MLSVLRNSSRSFRLVGTRGLANMGQMEPWAGRQPPVLTADEAMDKVLKSNSRVFLHSAAAYPDHLVKAMVRHADRTPSLRNVEVCHIHVEGSSPYSQPKYEGVFRTNNFFTGASQRTAIAEGRSDFVPIFLSEIPLLFKRNILPLDVALVSVTPPDRHGFCSLGPSCDISLEAVKSAKVTIAQVNNNLPRTHGESMVHITNFEYLVPCDEPLPVLKTRDVLPEYQAIGENIASLVEDGSTLQMGIGGIPDAALNCLGDRKHLGIHTEMFSEGVIDLVEKGVITNKYKAVLAYKLVASFLIGSQRLFDFVDDNPFVHMAPVSFVNDPAVIKRNPKVVAINSAIEVDMTGQVCADSIGTRIYSGTGGQMDFERGAALSEGGKPIIALPSRTTKGKPRIVPFLAPGAGVVTTRSHAHWIITEYGKVNLFGKNLRQRAEGLISIAHPDDRAALYDEGKKRYGKDFGANMISVSK